LGLRKTMKVSETELEYVYFQADEGGYVGYFKDFPQHLTQGETIEELEEMLLDMFECLLEVKVEPVSEEESVMIDEAVMMCEKDPSSYSDWEDVRKEMGL